MKKDFFNTTRIFDGGMGQELLNRGVKPVSNLWSASALVDPQYHKIVVETHLDFINAGSEMILTNTFGSRKRRIIENKMIDRFAEINITAGKLAKEAVIRSGKKVLIGGSLPPQNFTYISDLGSDLNFIRKSFEEQANFILPYIDFYYLDVMSSFKECELAIESISKFNKPIIIGIHIRQKGKLPSDEEFPDVLKKIIRFKPLAIILTCVSPEDFNFVVPYLKGIDIPWGFKFNAFEFIHLGWKPDSNNPKSELGSREDLTPKKFKSLAEKFVKLGAKIIGGCCEITPRHIKELKNINL